VLVVVMVCILLMLKDVGPRCGFVARDLWGLGRVRRSWALDTL